MKPSSAKAKGRNLQQLVVKKIHEMFPTLQEGDVLSTSMGAGGVDIKLSPAARKLFPYSVECKNVESLNVWKAWAQCTTNLVKGTQPMLVIKKNRQEPLVVVTLDEFMRLINDRSEF